MIGGTRGSRAINKRLPSARRCKQCLVPFQGLFSLPCKAIWIRPSRKNPQLCTM